ncbi:MAG: hypothetical protein WB679_06385 [Terracidiphilus sp.]
MPAYHSDPALKQEFLAYVNTDYTRLVLRSHFKSDHPPDLQTDIADAIQGNLGIPTTLAHLFYALRSHFDEDARKTWFERFFGAIKPGSELFSVADKFVYWVLTDAEGPRKTSPETDRKRIDRTAELYARRISGDEPTEDEWEDIRFVSPFGVWFAQQEQRSQTFAMLAHFAGKAGDWPFGHSL